jgi:hemerythrin HHE cation binding domain-containing protein
MAKEAKTSTQRTDDSESKQSGGVASGGKSSDTSPGSTSAGSPQEYLKTQHRELRSILNKRAGEKADRPTIVREFAMTWIPHSSAEEEILIPALRRAGADDKDLGANGIRRDLVNLVLADLLENASTELAEAKLDTLAELFDALARRSEEGDLLTQIASEEGSDASLEEQVKSRFDRIKSRLGGLGDDIGEAMDLLAPRILSVSLTRQRRGMEQKMSRYSNMRERDDQGRFISDDERGYSSRGNDRERGESGRFVSEGRQSRSRYDDDDDRDYRRGSRNGPERDDYGRFTSEGRSRGRYEDEDERYGRRSMARERDDEGRYMRRGSSSEGRGHGGWFGDREGHSEASRRGWDDPRHGESGWYGDSEGHSEASRRGWDNPRHGESGWYGDPEGHSEASRRGWDERGRGRSSSSPYDEIPSRSRSRYDDDDDRGGRSRGHGGWSGDPEGHSEAARRRWENRR